MGSFAGEKGRELYAGTLAATRPDAPAEEKLPARVALAALSLPAGETLALGGWPRASSSNFWQQRDGEWLPPGRVVEEKFPPAWRLRYEGDRNFDPLLVGSATKPLWAAAVLSVHPNLDKKLQVKGNGPEKAVFGVNISDRPWEAGVTGWVDFNAFLKRSDNRYQVRLGFLGLANKPGGEVIAEGDSPLAVNESLNGGKPTAWGKFPQFPDSLEFSARRPNKLAGLQQTPLAAKLRELFAVSLEAGAGRDFQRYRASFWTKNEYDDLARAFREADENKYDKPRATGLSELFGGLAPVHVNLALDQNFPGNEPQSSARNYVTLLLGGLTNRWANVDLAAAFGTSLTGRPVSAHIVRNDEAAVFVREKSLSDGSFNGHIAERLRPGLEAVVFDSQGTANVQFQKNRAALIFLENLRRRGYNVYAKTGTLSGAEGEAPTSRIILAIVKWKAEKRGEAERGLIFSLVAERAETGRAALWLGEFLQQRQSEISRWLEKK